jgi:hypothetical protein
MADTTINVTEVNDAAQKLVRLKAIAGDADSAYAISTQDAVLLAQIQSMNPLSSVTFDSILITYTDATKATISKVEWKLGAAVVKTLTLTAATLTDSWVKS